MTGAHKKYENNAAEQTPRLATIIVNYRAGELIVQNLEGLVAQHRPYIGSQLYIVDNLSGNGDAQLLQSFVDAQNLSDIVTIIAHPLNSGWGGGNNVGLREIQTNDLQPDYVLFLNPDASLKPGSLTQLIEFLDTHPKAGFAGCQIEDLDGHIQSAAFRFHSIASEFESTIRTGPISRILKKSIVAMDKMDQPMKVDWVSGAAFIARLQAVKECGFFDEGYFLYFDETDIMRSASEKGWQVWHIPEVQAIHQEGFSTGTKGGVNVEDQPLSDHYFRSRNFYFSKQNKRLRHALADLAWLSGTLLYGLRCLLSRKPAGAQWQRIHDFMRHFGKTQRLK